MRKRRIANSKSFAKLTVIPYTIVTDTTRTSGTLLNKENKIKLRPQPLPETERKIREELKRFEEYLREREERSELISNPMGWQERIADNEKKNT